MSTPHERLTGYLRTTGWTPPEEEGPVGGLWRHRGSGSVLPVPHELSEDGYDWPRLTEQIASVERTDVRDILSRIEARLLDVVNLRAANDIVIRDTIPYSAGVTLVRESWTMLRSAATTALGAKPHIRGNYRARADEIIEHARLAHTKRGSFIIPIHLPLPEPEPVADSLFDDFHAAPESEERRIMRTFAEALYAMNEIAIRPEREPSTDDMVDLVRNGVSHEFSSALQRVLQEEAVAEFSAAFEWATAIPAPPSTPSDIAVPSAAQARIKRVAQRLKSETPAQPTEFLTGPIVGVHRDPQTQSGDVTVQTTRSGRSTHVTVNVSPDVLDRALDWMKAREVVYVESKVHKTSRGLLADRADAIAPMRLQHLH